MQVTWISSFQRRAAQPVEAADGRLPPPSLGIFDLWDKLHLNQPGFTGGNLIAF